MFFFSSAGTHIDVAVVHPSATSYLSYGRKPLGTTARHENLKSNTYLQQATAEGARFYPFVLESYGAVGKFARQFIGLLVDEALGNGITSINGLKVSDFILRSLSVTLQSGNCYLLTMAAKQARQSRKRRT